MSVLSDLFSGLLGDEEQEAVDRPCSNCASDCALYPNVCDSCKPLKEKLIDLLYNVEHIDEFRDRYEVVTTVAEDTGSEACPHCGGSNPANAIYCEYCGSKLREGTNKIQVTSAKEIPNPILEAQDVIFERHELIEDYTERPSGLLDALMDMFDGDDDTFGGKMTEDEIKATAAAYGVSVAAYLQGLDNGKYLTADMKKRTQSMNGSSSFAGPAAAAMMFNAGRSTRSMGFGAPIMRSVPRRSPMRPPMPTRPPVQQTRRPAAPPIQNQRRQAAPPVPPTQQRASTQRTPAPQQRPPVQEKRDSSILGGSILGGIAQKNKPTPPRPNTPPQGGRPAGGTRGPNRGGRPGGGRGR